MDDDDEFIVSSNKRRKQSINDSRISTSSNKHNIDVDNDDDDNNKGNGKNNDSENTKKKAPEALKGASGGYAWEDEYRRSWDIVQEDESGSIESIVSGLVESQKKRFLKNVTPFQRGIIRTMVLVLDYSSVMREKDFRPNRSSMMISYAIEFVSDFFDQNPISQLSIVIMRNGLAQAVSEVSGNPNDHIEALKKLKRVDPEGDPSLQNALEMSRGLLLHVASHCTREILIIFGALFTSDPGNIHHTIKSLVKEKIIIRVIGLTARVAICEELCKLTNFGDLKSSYNVVLNETHFKELILDCVTPLAVTKAESENTDGFTLVKMGFPSRVSDTEPTLCSCHSKLVYGGYICPNCKSRVCTLPTVCPCCDLMLILSTHLARSYHHLFPLKLFADVPISDTYPSSNCYSCQIEFPKGKGIKLENSESENKQKISYRYRCTDCGRDFCIDCEVFIHETLHNCPGCESASYRK
jgi:transcription initiation factor TFIIH subunit 2